MNGSLTPWRIRGTYFESCNCEAICPCRMPVLLLTTTGRRSGRVTTTPLTYLESDTGIVVVGSNGGEDTAPSWWLNLLANPEATITRGRRSEPVVARPATATEHARLWPAVIETNPGYARYAARTSRPIPLVVLSPV